MEQKFSRWLVFIFLGCFLLSCSSPDIQDVEVIPETIVVYGDSRTNHNIHQDIVEAMIRVKPAAVFHSGDLVEDGLDPDQWVIFNEIVAPLLQMADFYPALGNHEYNSTLYFDNFNLPNNERWYVVDINNLHFIILDSNFPLGPGSEQYIWFRKNLEQVAGTGVFLIVVFHHPPYSSGPHESDEKGLRETIVPLFEMYWVQIVFTGHDHFYERSLKNNVFYVVTGGGGAPLHDRKNINPFSQVFLRQYHFCRLHGTENQLIVEVFSRYLEKIDHFVVQK